LQLALQSGPQLARSAACSRLAAGERRLIDGELHAKGRLADFEAGQRFRLISISDRVPDGNVGKARDVDDLAGRGGFGRAPLQRLDRQQGGDPLSLAGTGLADADHVLTRTQRASRDPPDGEPADVVVVIQVAHEQLQRAVGIA